MYKDETTYYPFSEVSTQLIPVTIGCAHKKCTFCAMYESSSYSEVPLSEIDYELQYGNEFTERVFLTGADPLYIGYKKMCKVLELIRKRLPVCACVAAYASVRTIAKYSIDELKHLHELGLRLLYIGFESGSDEVLKNIKKGHTVEQAIEQAKKLNEAKIPFNSIIMYGIAGRDKGIWHAEKTAEMLNQFQSYRIVTMNLTVFDSTEIAIQEARGEFVQASRSEKAEELETLIKLIEPQNPTIFDTTHPTNLVKVCGVLPYEREVMLEELKKQL